MRFRSTVLALALFALSFLHTPRASASPPQDSAAQKLIAVVDQAQLTDSLEASTDEMVPFRSEIVRAARKHHLPPALLAAFCQEESQFNPWAERMEPGYLRNPKIRRASKDWSRRHGGLPTALTEQNDRSRSMGLMQPMGEVAREQGDTAKYLSTLFEPFESIDQGAILLKKLLNRYGRDTLAAISAYNQGNARKLHGSFANARYVYRVNVAWEHYDDLFFPNHYGHDLHTGTNLRTFSLPASASRSYSADTVSSSHQADSTTSKAGGRRGPNDNDEGGTNQIASRHGSSANRNYYASGGDRVQAESIWDRSTPVERVGLGLVMVLALCACVGLAYLSQRHNGIGSGLNLHGLQSDPGHVRPVDQGKQTPPAGPSSLHRA